MQRDWSQYNQFPFDNPFQRWLIDKLGNRVDQTEPIDSSITESAPPAPSAPVDITGKTGIDWLEAITQNSGGSSQPPKITGEPSAAVGTDWLEQISGDLPREGAKEPWDMETSWNPFGGWMEAPGQLADSWKREGEERQKQSWGDMYKEGFIKALPDPLGPAEVAAKVIGGSLIYFGSEVFQITAWPAQKIYDKFTGGTRTDDEIIADVEKQMESITSHFMPADATKMSQRVMPKLNAAIEAFVSPAAWGEIKLRSWGVSPFLARAFRFLAEYRLFKAAHTGGTQAVKGVKYIADTPKRRQSAKEAEDAINRAMEEDLDAEGIRRPTPEDFATPEARQKYMDEVMDAYEGGVYGGKWTVEQMNAYREAANQARMNAETKVAEELRKPAETMKRSIVKPPTKEDLATPEARQAYLDKVMKEYEDGVLSGEWTVDQMNAYRHAANQMKLYVSDYPKAKGEPKPPWEDIVVEEPGPRKPVSGEKPIEQTNTEARQAMEQSRDMVQGIQADPHLDALHKVNAIRVAQGLEPYPIPQRGTPVRPTEAKPVEPAPIAPEPIAPPPVVEPRRTVSGEKSVAQTNREAKQAMERSKDLVKGLQPDKPITAIENINAIRADLGLEPLPTPKPAARPAEAPKPAETSGAVSKAGERFSKASPEHQAALIADVRGKLAELEKNIAPYKEGLYKDYPELEGTKQFLAENERLIAALKETLAEYERIQKTAEAPKPAASVEIPTLKSTNEAFDFGRKATPEQIAELKRLEQVRRDKFQQLMAEAKKPENAERMMDLMDEAMAEAQKAQFFREAHEYGEGKITPESIPKGMYKPKDSEAPKASPETPSVQPLNEAPKKTKLTPEERRAKRTEQARDRRRGKAEEVDLESYPDWVEGALEEIYNERPVSKNGKPTRMYEIARSLLETGEIPTAGLMKTFKKWYDLETKKKQRIADDDARYLESKRAADDAHLAGLERVDPDTGRAPGTAPMIDPATGKSIEGKFEAIEAPERGFYTTPEQALADLLYTGLITNSKGKVLSDKLIAQMYAEQAGYTGKLVKDPESGGWRIRQSKEDLKRNEQMLTESWAKKLESETLEDIKASSDAPKPAEVRTYTDAEGRQVRVFESVEPKADVQQQSLKVDMNPDSIASDFSSILGNKRGEMVIDFGEIPKAIDRLKQRFGKSPKAISLHNKLRQVMKKMDLETLGISEFLLTKKATDTINWEEMLKEVKENRPEWTRVELTRGDTLYSPREHPRYNLESSFPMLQKVSYKEILYKAEPQVGEFREGHWGPAGHAVNTAAHLRIHRRKVDEKRSARPEPWALDDKMTTHVDELQSVWSEKGRAQGFTGGDLAEMKKAQAEIERIDLRRSRSFSRGKKYVEGHVDKGYQDIKNIPELYDILSADDPVRAFNRHPVVGQRKDAIKRLREKKASLSLIDMLLTELADMESNVHSMRSVVPGMIAAIKDGLPPSFAFGNKVKRTRGGGESHLWENNYVGTIPYDFFTDIAFLADFIGATRHQNYKKSVMSILDNHRWARELWEEKRHYLMRKVDGGVPPIPHIADFYKIGMRDALSEAVKEGDRWLTWTTAEQQIRRWGAETAKDKQIHLDLEKRVNQFVKEEFGETPKLLNTRLRDRYVLPDGRWVDPDQVRPGELQTLQQLTIAEPVWGISISELLQKSIDHDLAGDMFGRYGKGTVRDIVQGTVEAGPSTRTAALMSMLKLQKGKSTASKILGNQRGELTIDLSSIGGKIVKLFSRGKDGQPKVNITARQAADIRRLFESGQFLPKDLMVAMRAKGIPEDVVTQIMTGAAERVIAYGPRHTGDPTLQGESQYLRKGDNPNEFLPRRNKGGGREAPALTRGEAHMILTAKNIDKRLFNENWSWEVGWKTFERITDVNGKGLSDTFYWALKDRGADAVREFKQKQKESASFRRGLSRKQQENIGIHALWEQGGGEAIANQMGIFKRPELTPKEMNAYNWMQKEMKDFYVRVNEARKASGEKQFPAVPNYFTWYQDMAWLRKEHGIGLTDKIETIDAAHRQYLQQGTPSLKGREKHRTDKDIPRKLELNAFTVYERSAHTYLETIHKAETLAKLKEMLSSRFKLAERAPALFDFLSQWRSYQTGAQHPLNMIHPKTKRVISALNRNVAMAILSYNVRSALIQPTALLGAAVHLNHWLAVGMVQAMDPKLWREAYQKSSTLTSRTPDVQMHEAYQGVNQFKGVQKTAFQVGTAPLSALDKYSATATWLGAYAKAKSKGMPEPHRYADKIVDKTSSTSAPTDRAPIQRHTMGMVGTTLQTWVINNWSWLARDIMGYKNPNIKNMQRLTNISKYVAGTALINWLYEDYLGLDSPLGTPIRSFQEEMEKQDDPTSVKAYIASSAAAVQELIEYVPMVGGAIKFNSQIGGVLVSELKQISDDLEAGKWPIRTVARGVGLPGVNQFSKSYNAWKNGGDAADMFLGRHVEGTDRYQRPTRASRPNRPTRTSR